MKKLPISIQTFADIISGGMIYVDKTRHVWNLAGQGKYYFLARPRRFGKSLLLTTLKSYFEGRKDLFAGLYLATKEKSWKEYPVIHIDYSLVSYRDGKEVFHQSLLSHLKMIAAGFNLTLHEKQVGNALTELVQKLYDQRGPVVVLVDEYDKPMVDTLTQPNQFEENKSILRDLYGAMKGLDQYLRFVLLTGVSRFAKVNVFSGMNNLQDISESPEFATAVGFTQPELEAAFSAWIETLNQKFAMPRAELLGHIQHWYNGFSFDGHNKLYNPFSILNLFANLEFGNYWFSSGTPTFLVDLIKLQKKLPESFEGVKVFDLTGSTEQIDDFPLYPLLFQTGYLTIEKMVYDGLVRVFYLNYPNEEVRQSFIRYIAAAFVGKHQFDIQPEALALRDALLEEQPDQFVNHLQSFLSDIPHQLHIPAEAYYHSLVYMMLRLVGVQLILEKSTDKGRIDAVLELADKVYIIEFKFGKNERVKSVKTLSRQAIDQIERNRYFEPYLASGKKIILFGIGFLDKKLDGKVQVFNN